MLPPARPCRGGALPPRVFLAEDNDDLARLVARRFAERKWTLVRASTAKEAAPRLRGDRFDAVILDYQLPDGTGLDLLGVVREAAPATPVLFLTAHGSEDIALRALGLGATDYMQKSGTLLDELPARVEQLLAREPDLRSASTVVTVPVHEKADAVSREGLSPDEARRLVESFVKGDVIGAAFFDGAGESIAALMPESVDPKALGFALVQIHAQAVLMGRTTRLAPRAYAFTLDTDEGILAATGIAGRALVAVLVRPGSTRANDRLEALAGQLR